MRPVMIAAVIAAVLLPLVPADAQQDAPADVTGKINALVDRQTNLLVKRDAAGLAGLFTVDAVYATASGEVFAGRDKIKDYYSQTIPALGEFTRQSAADEIHAIGTGAWARGHGTTAVKTNEGVSELKDHWIAVYELVDGEWKVRALSLGENVKLLPGKF